MAPIRHSQMEAVPFEAEIVFHTVPWFFLLRSGVAIIADLGKGSAGFQQGVCHVGEFRFTASISGRGCDNGFPGSSECRSFGVLAPPATPLLCGAATATPATTTAATSAGSAHKTEHCLAE